MAEGTLCCIHFILRCRIYTVFHYSPSSTMQNFVFQVPFSRITLKFISKFWKLPTISVYGFFDLIYKVFCPIRCLTFTLYTMKF